MTIRRLKRVRIWSSLRLALDFDSVLDQMFESVVRSAGSEAEAEPPLRREGASPQRRTYLSRRPSEARTDTANGHGERNAGADAL